MLCRLAQGPALGVFSPRAGLLAEPAARRIPASDGVRWGAPQMAGMHDAMHAAHTQHVLILRMRVACLQ